MPFINYSNQKFKPATMITIDSANDIIREYEAQGFTLTLRQLYYQFVARDLINNKQSEYKRLGDIINNARMAGLIDWWSMEDRTRNLMGNQHWNSPEQIMRSVVHSYQIDMWQNQDYHVEVWIEKDALVGVISSICSRLDVNYFSCRGYVSASEMWRAGQRMDKAVEKGKKVLVLHLGDHTQVGWI